MELTNNTSSRSQPSHKLEKEIVKRLTLIEKKTPRNTLKKTSRTYHVKMFFFSLIHFVASMKILDPLVRKYA